MDDENNMMTSQERLQLTSVGSLRRFSDSLLGLYELAQVGAEATGGTCWQNKPSISSQSMSFIGEFS